VAVVVHPNVQPPDGFLDAVLQILAESPGSQALAIEVPRTGVCLAGPSELLRTVGASAPGSLFEADGIALAKAMESVGARLAFVPATR
jgi:hypothetical protein